MAVTDGYLRSYAKVSPTDGWLHVAGPAGGLPPFLYGSGNLVSVTSLTSIEMLVDSGLVTSSTVLDALTTLIDSGGVVTVAVLEALAALSDTGLTATTALLSAAEALTDSNIHTSISSFEALEALAAKGDVESIAIIDGIIGVLINVFFGKLVSDPSAEIDGDPRISFVTSTGGDDNDTDPVMPALTGGGRSTRRSSPRSSGMRGRR